MWLATSVILDVDNKLSVVMLYYKWLKHFETNLALDKMTPDE